MAGCPRARRGSDENAAENRDVAASQDVAPQAAALEEKRAVARRALAAEAAYLLALRDGELADASAVGEGKTVAPPGDSGSLCRRFEELGPRSVFEERKRRGVPSACGLATEVRCLEAPTGFYVPLAPPKNWDCVWDLWFVPRRGTDAARFSGFPEYDDSFTSSMLVDDLDHDGVSEAVIVRDGKPPSSGKGVFLVEPTGASVASPFSALRDVDGDGRLDGIWEFRAFLGYEEPSPEPLFLRGPGLLAHRLADGTFSLGDDVARAQRRKDCRAPLTPLVTGLRGIPGANESARRVACRLVDNLEGRTADAGANIGALRRELADSCAAAHKDAETCRKLGIDVGMLIDELTMFAAWPARSPYPTPSE
jgi:hypothetical protein